jgi:hypothetical protein
LKFEIPEFARGRGRGLKRRTIRDLKFQNLARQFEIPDFATVRGGGWIEKKQLPT